MPRSPKQRSVAEWQISHVAKKAIYLGKVEAADAETAIKAAIKKFDVNPDHQNHLQFGSHRGSRLREDRHNEHNHC